MPVFSVIVPVYNVEAYLEECIHSVLNQTFADWELILVDDGSPDLCPRMCDDWAEKDDRIKVVHKKNGGASDARNFGLNTACGDYVLFLDGDDFYNSNRTLEVLYQKIRKQNADVVIFGCTDWNMETDETVVSRTGYDLDLIEKGNQNVTLHYLLSQKMIPGGPTIFCTSRRVIQENDIRFKIGIQDEDYDYVLSVFTHCTSISAINDPFYTYRKGRADSVTGSSSVKMIEGIAYTIKKWVPICNQMHDDRIKKDILNYLAFIYSTGFVVTGRLKGQDKNAAIQIMKKYKSVLKHAYWKKTRIIKFSANLFGYHLFSWLADKYFTITHISR